MDGLTTTLELINGKLRSYTSIGGYPVFYLDAKDNCLCPDCATESFLDEDELPDFKVKYGAVNWEGSLYCDRCSEEIESAYGEDENDEDEDY